MKRPDPWLALVAASRRAPAPEPALLPPGFATRVAARALAARETPSDFFGAFALRALGVALALVVTSAAISYPAATAADNSPYDQDDPLAELVGQL